MTVAISVAVEQGAQGGRLRVHRQHQRLDGGLRRRAGHAARARAAGQDRGRQDGAGDGARRAGDQVTATSTTACGRPRLAEHYPVSLVNSVNPLPARGAEDGRLRDRGCPRRRPDVHVLPVGNAGNISAYWNGYVRVRRERPRNAPAADAGLPGRRRGTAGPRRPVAAPGDRRDGDPDRQPRVLAAGVAAARRVRRPDRAVTDEEILQAPADLAGGRASSSSRPRRPASPGCSRPDSARASRRGPTVVVTVTGHGLKDIDTALDDLVGASPDVTATRTPMEWPEPPA